jgi:hypothetical protein
MPNFAYSIVLTKDSKTGTIKTNTITDARVELQELFNAMVDRNALIFVREEKEEGE